MKQRRWQKYSIAVLFGVLLFVAFVLSPKDISCLTALGGGFVGLAGWFHQANIKEHKIKNGGDNNG